MFMALIKDAAPAWLVLADGQVFRGKRFGDAGTSIGEVVFTTGMTGYQETLTDPSYYGQIVTQTFPLIGNYGVNSEDFESASSHVKGYIVREWCNTPSNFRCEDTIDSFLRQRHIIGLWGIDTRRLTRTLREAGVMNGVITTLDPAEHLEALLEEIRAYAVTQAVESVTGSEVHTFTPEQARYRVVLLDFGYKRYIRKSLMNRGCEVLVVPALTSPQEIAAMQPDGIMLSNGPGDPADNPQIIRNLRELSGLGIPMFGICLGHQLMALAMGAKTEKLKYGHRGANQPVIDLQSGKTYVTSQNHGYAVIGDSLDPDTAEVSHVNANDGTCEGVRYKSVNAFTVQFHPEAHGAPLDTAYLFDEFTSRMASYKEGK